MRDAAATGYVHVRQRWLVLERGQPAASPHREHSEREHQPSQHNAQACLSLKLIPSLWRVTRPESEMNCDMFRVVAVCRNAPEFSAHNAQHHGTMIAISIVRRWRLRCDVCIVRGKHSVNLLGDKWRSSPMLYYGAMYVATCCALVAREKCA
jgi:hypothetical protein